MKCETLVDANGQICMDSDGRICAQCKIYKIWDEFYNKSWCVECKKNYTTTHKANRKKTVMNHYGGTICACCGETGIDFLTLDHIAGGGRKHRQEKCKDDLYGWLRRNNYPDGFQVLCSNCNLAKHLGDGTCRPHGKVLTGV